MNDQTKKIAWILLGLVALVLVFTATGVIALPQKLGKERGAVVLEIQADDKVFVDNVLQKTRKTQDGRLVYVAPGNRDVLVSREGYWPWIKQVMVGEGKVEKIFPFFFREYPLLEKIQEDNPEYDALVALTRKAQIPNTPQTLISKDKTVTVWKEAAFLKARWIGEGDAPSFFCNPTCSSTMNFLQLSKPIDQLLFLKNRNDVVITTVGKDVFALELDQKPVQNFQKIYGGNQSVFVGITENDELFIKDGDTLYHLLN